MKLTVSRFSAARIAVRPLIGLLLAAFLVLPVPVAHGQDVAAKFTVKFKANGGTGTMKKQTFKSGVSQRLRKNAFKRSGGVFVGWAWSKNGTVAYKNRQIVKDLAVGGTVTLYARWAKSTYKVRFKANGGKGKMSVESFKYGKSKKLSKNRFKRNGYVFRGWSNRANGEAMFSDGQKVKNLTKTGKTIHLFAVWVKKEYTVRPAAPSWVSASNGEDDDVYVEWGASAGTTTYDVYRATSSYSTPSWIASTTSTWYSDYDATPGTTYYYWITASNDAGTSDYSDYDSGWRAVPAPAAPSWISASDGEYDGYVYVEWDSSDFATSYDIYRATSSYDTPSWIDSTTSTWYSDYNATPSTTYYYWVTASNDAGTSGYSDCDSGRRTLQAPSPPSSVSASDGTNNSYVYIRWNSSSGATSYDVYRATSSYGTRSRIGSTTSTSYYDYNATRGTTYYYWVTASNDAGTSGYSDCDSGWRSYYRWF